MQTTKRKAGFTLVEVLAVIVILSILMAVLVTRLGGLGEAADVRATKALLLNYDIAISEYETEFGDYPPSQLKDEWGATNTTNVGVEALVLSLWSNEWEGTSLSIDDLVNLDGDFSKAEVSEILGKELWELADRWGNPIAYVHHRDYGRKDNYETENPETGELVESTVIARMGHTGSYARPNKYQLISAGPDGAFGTEDDIVTFKTE
jgi:prepilin-type N-terminal cleavage/methylation domain-containing protein